MQKRGQGESVEINFDNFGNGTVPEWIHVIPMGKFMTRDGRGPFMMDDPQTVIDNTVRYHGTTDIPVDYDHQLLWTRSNGQPAPAAGWIKELAAKSDGIWGRVDWTGTASARISAKEYRYLSPVFLYDQSGKVTLLECVALVNNPALELTAVASIDFGLIFQSGISKDERAICAQLGISEAVYCQSRNAIQCDTAIRQQYTIEEREICARLGISAKDYLSLKG